MNARANTRAGRSVNSRANNNVGRNVKGECQGNPAYHPRATARALDATVVQPVATHLTIQKRSRE